MKINQSPYKLKLIYIPNDDTQNYSSVDYNYWLKRLNTELNKPINQNSIKVLKVGKTANKKTLLYKTLGTSVINSP